MSDTYERLSDEAVDVAARGHNNTWTLVEVVRSLAREVREWRALALAEKCVNPEHAKLLRDNASLVAQHEQDAPLVEVFLRLIRYGPTGVWVYVSEPSGPYPAYLQVDGEVDLSPEEYALIDRLACECAQNNGLVQCNPVEASAVMVSGDPTGIVVAGGTDGVDTYWKQCPRHKVVPSGA